MPSVRHSSTSSSSNDNKSSVEIAPYDNSIDKAANNEFERFTRCVIVGGGAPGSGGTNQMLPQQQFQFHNYTTQSSNVKTNSATTTTKPTCYSIDYGFDLTSSLSPSIFTTSNTIASNTNNSNHSNSSTTSSSSSSHNQHQQLPQLTEIRQSTLATANSKDAMLVFSENMKSNEDLLYEHVLNKLAQASIDSPAHVPLLCVSTFSSNPSSEQIKDSKWHSVLSRLSALGINVRLVDLLIKGVPVNALFYLSNLDLIYVRTADELEGYVPRECCRPISCCNCSSLPVIASNNIMSISSSKSLPPLVAATSHFNDQYNFVPITNNNADNESIKYHSLSSSEYDDLIETSNSSAGCPQPPSFKAVRDSGYKSEFEVNQDTDNCVKVVNNVPGTPSSSKKLEKMQSRSRIPVTIGEGSNLNLTLIDSASLSYKVGSPMPPPLPRPRQNCTPNPLIEPKRNAEFQRTKNTRRSLDSNLTNNNKNKFYAIPIDLCEKHSSSDLSDLDLKKIELDSLDIANDRAGVVNNGMRLCRVVARHDARNFQELSVMPGMLVNVLKVFNDRIYVQLAGMEHSSLDMSQQYGILPRGCVDLRFIDNMDDTKSDDKSSSSFLINSINRIKYTSYNAAAGNRRKSQQITAL